MAEINLDQPVVGNITLKTVLMILAVILIAALVYYFVIRPQQASTS